MTDATSQRLDAFTDAAFAFAVTLLVVGAGGQPVDADLLGQTIASIPSFAIGFAIIAMFWYGHVTWRQLRGVGDGQSTALTLLLVFVTLIYVVPLRGMATSLADYVRGVPSTGGVDIATLFLVYGIGFTAMSLVTALLFRDALRNAALTAQQRRATLGQVWIWAILAWTGVLSTIAVLTPLRAIAPWLYATLPVTIPLFVWWWDWEESVDRGGGGAGDAAAQPVLAPDDVQAAGDDERRAEPG